MEWDTTPGADWLERQEREIDNFRAALHWSVEGASDPEPGARIASGIGPVFLRLSMLREGARWGERALERAPDLIPRTGARIHYALSMLYNNTGSYVEALSHAEHAVALYKMAGDRRGEARALSQVAQQSVNNGFGEQARAAADDALSLSRSLGDDALLAAVLARCTNAVDAGEVDTSRERYRESVTLFRNAGRVADAARVLQWWAGTEALNGHWSQARHIIEQVLPLATGELEMWATSAAATIYWALNDREQAIPLTRRALELSGAVAHPVVLPSVVSYTALIARESDAEEAARLLAYADEKQRKSGDVRTAAESKMFERLIDDLRAALDEARLSRAQAEGASWTDEQAYARAKRV